jgi:photosystem II PsbM protein
MLSLLFDGRKQAQFQPTQREQRQQMVEFVSEKKTEALKAMTVFATASAAFPSFAQNEVSEVALANVNILGVIATALFIIIPTSFLIILFVKSQAEGNVSGGFSQSYYDQSKKQGKKLTNEAAVLKGKGVGMRPSK